jgi:hypothetical protein
MSPKVYAPNVHLLAFHLQKSANGNNANDQDKHWLWQTCNQIIQKILQPNFDLMQWLDLNKEPNNPTVSLIKAEKQINAAPIDKGEIYLDDNSPLLIEGFAYPLRLYDSYGLWLNLRHPEKDNHNQRTEDVDIQVFRKLNPDNCLLLGGNENFLNQTLIITAWLSSEQDPQNQKALKNLADECLQAFFPNNYPIPPFAGSATLFGSPIFEYGLFSQLTNYRHILVWFFSHPEAEEKFNSYQEQLLDLWFFRAKVVKAFQKSREVYEDTNKEYQKIEAEINNFQQIDPQLLNDEKLDKLSEKLKTLPQMALDYANFLRYLESYQNTIAINGRNYADRLQQIRGILKDEDISFLEKFSVENSPDFQEQIKAELGYFTHGSSLLDKAIASIRGRVEIDRAKSDRLTQDKKETSDRNLQITILAVGTGIGAGGIMVSSYSLVQNDPILQVLHTPVTNRFTAAIAYSLLFGLTIGILIWASDKLWQSHKRKNKA